MGFNRTVRWCNSRLLVVLDSSFFLLLGFFLKNKIDHLEEGNELPF